MKRTLAVTIITILCLSLVPVAMAQESAFQQAQQEILLKMGEVGQASGDYNVGALIITLTNPFWVTVQKGFSDVAADYGFEVDVLAAPSESDTAGQLNFLETMVNKNYDALAISPITPYNLIPGVESATRRNIPVVSVGTWLDEEVAAESGAQVEAVYSSDFEGQGYLGGKYIVEELSENGGGKVAIIEGIPGASQGEARKAGAIRAFAEDSSIELISTQPGDWDRTKALNITMNLIQANPDLKGIFCANDTMALAAVEALKAVGKKDQVVVVGVDYIPEALTSMQAGELDASVAQSPYLFGYIGGLAALKVLEGQELPQDVSIPIALVTQDNWENYADWK